MKEAKKTLITNNHSRVNLTDLSEIKYKKTGNCYLFYNKIYTNE